MAIRLLTCAVATFAMVPFTCATGREKSPKAAPQEVHAVKAGCANPIGMWNNQMGSKLNIKTVDANTGAISGEYETKTGAGGWFPLTGWVNELAPDPKHPDAAKIITFAVRWGSFGSITAWTGVCRGMDGLHTIWHLGRPNADFEWDHVLSGADTFTPQ
jgi:hypothetical protein